MAHGCYTCTVEILPALALAAGVVASGALMAKLAWGDKNTLAKLPAVAGEELRFELEGLTIATRSGNERSYTINAIVRVTDRRIIIAQRPLLRGEPMLSKVMTLVEPGRGTRSTLGTLLGQGYASCDISPDQIALSQDSRTIIITGPGIVGTETIQIPIPDPSPWRDAGLIG